MKICWLAICNMLHLCHSEGIPRRGKASYMTVYLASDLSYQVLINSKFKVHLNLKIAHAH